MTRLHLWCLIGALWAGGCASSAARQAWRLPREQTTNCPSLEGLYLYTPDSCRMSQGLVPLPLEGPLFPDGTSMPRYPALIGIHQTACSEVSFGVRPMDPSSAAIPMTFAVTIANDVNWIDGSLVGKVTATVNPPLPIPASGFAYWRLSRGPNGAVVLTSGYAEQGLFIAGYREHVCSLPPYSAPR